MQCGNDFGINVMGQLSHGERKSAKIWRKAIVETSGGRTYMGRKVTGMMRWGEMSSEEICGSTEGHVFVTLTRQQEATSCGMEGNRMYVPFVTFILSRSKFTFITIQ